jgi:hypothetical protein
MADLPGLAFQLLEWATRNQALSQDDKLKAAVSEVCSAGLTWTAAFPRRIRV